MASVYRRGKTWWVKYYANGKQVFKSLKTEKKSDAVHLKQALEAQLVLEPDAVQSVDSQVSVFWPE